LVGLAEDIGEFDSKQEWRNRTGANYFLKMFPELLIFVWMCGVRWLKSFRRYH
jgi:hypothetical protein